MKSQSRSQCPHCSSRSVLRSHRRNMLERMLSLVRVLPYRCAACNYRFSSLRSMTPSSRYLSPPPLFETDSPARVQFRPTEQSAHIPSATLEVRPTDFRVSTQ